jgi:hypothetical protein
MEAAPLATRLTTYAELQQIVQAFARGHLNLLILIGGHGLGKSRIVRQALAGQACWLKVTSPSSAFTASSGNISISRSFSMTSMVCTPSVTAFGCSSA